MDKLLITGAAGQSGSIILRELAYQGVPVRALVRNRQKARFADDLPGVEIFEGDMLRRDTIYPVLEGVERALLISTPNDKMVETQCSFIDACRHMGVPHVVKFSGEEAQTGFEAANFRYAREHEEIEDYLEHSGMIWTHLRPSQFMQVYLREVAAIKNLKELRLPFGNIRLSPVDLNDVAKVVVKLMTRGGYGSATLRLTGPEALSMAEIAAIISKVTFRAVHYVDIPWEERSKGFLAAGLPVYLVQALEEQRAERLRHPEAFVDLETHWLFDVTPTSFEQFALRHAVDFGG